MNTHPMGGIHLVTHTSVLGTLPLKVNNCSNTVQMG